MAPGRRLTALAALGAALALAGCGTGGSGSSEATGESQTEAAAPPLSHADYQAALTEAANPVRSALERIEAARKYRPLLASVRAAEKAARRSADTLGGLAPPADAAGPHARLVKGLEQLARALGKTADAIDARSVCAAPSVLARLGQAEPADLLRSAVRTLRAQGLEIGALSPRRVATPTRRLANGEILIALEDSGRGELSVQNGLGLDAVVTLVEGTRRAASVFVRRNASTTITGIPDGTYRVFFTIGIDWDRDLRAFTRKCGFERFDDPVAFETTYTSSGVERHTYEITLHEIYGGTASTSDVDPGEFPGG